MAPEIEDQTYIQSLPCLPDDGGRLPCKSLLGPSASYGSVARLAVQAAFRLDGDQVERSGIPERPASLSAVCPQG